MRLSPHVASPVHRQRTGLLWAVPVALALSLGGCTEDPFERPGTWRPAGVNETNLRAQVTDPAVLQRGVGAGTDRGQQGSTAITTLEEGKRPAVPTTRLTSIGAGGSAVSAR